MMKWILFYRKNIIVRGILKNQANHPEKEKKKFWKCTPNGQAMHVYMIHNI